MKKQKFGKQKVEIRMGFGLLPISAFCFLLSVFGCATPKQKQKAEIGKAEIGGPQQYIVPVRYPADVDPNDYWWNLEESKDLVTWGYGGFTQIETPTGVDWLVHRDANPQFWRLIRGPHK